MFCQSCQFKKSAISTQASVEQQSDEVMINAIHKKGKFPKQKQT